MDAPAKVSSIDSAALARARRGDEQAFDQLVAPLRGGLQAHCYRMLGSFHDAEEALQDALVRAWRALPRFEGRSSLRTWLTTIATNVCLTRIERRRPLMLPLDHGSAVGPEEALQGGADVGWLEPYPGDGTALGSAGPEARLEQRESIELAFVAALQYLPAKPRAVLLLRDVLGFSAKEAAGVLGAPVSTVTSALQRARAALRTRLPEASQDRRLRELGDGEVQRLAASYADAWERGDVDAIVALLTDDVTFAMPPNPLWLAGRDDVARFLPLAPLRSRWKVVPAWANGQLAMAFYERDERDGGYVEHSLDVLTLRGGEVVEVTAFLDLGARGLGPFGLPARMPGDARA